MSSWNDPDWNDLPLSVWLVLPLIVVGLVAALAILTAVVA